MKKQKGMSIFKLCIMGAIISFFALTYAWVGASYAAERPIYGGTLIYAGRSSPPSYDAHQELSVNVIHPSRPHYSLLLKFDPENYPKLVGDLAESWTISEDKKTYTFKIHKGVRFHDGSTLTAQDIKASYEHIIFPPPGIVSPRKAFYVVVDGIDAPDKHTVVFRLKWPAAHFLASLASPYNYIYKAELLSRDPHWYEKNIMGTGPFKFVEHVAGSHWVGKRNEDYFLKDRPYLDGYRVLFIKSTSTRVAAIRGGRAHIDFRFFSASQRDDLVRAMGDKIRVQESSIPVCFAAIFNCKEKPFDDPRVRRAMSLALDRWGASKTLSKISNMKWVGGLLRPGSEMAMTNSDVAQLAGFSKDIEASRKEARRLLREAGVPEGFSFTLTNRPLEGDYMTSGVWVIDQWRQIGLNVEQKGMEVGPYYAAIRKGDFRVAISPMSDYMDEPSLQFVRFISSDKTPYNECQYIDRVLDDLYLKQSQAMDPEERRRICRQFQVRVLDEMAYVLPFMWYNRIVPHSAKLKGWTMMPSHFLGVDLTNVWLSEH